MKLPSWPESISYHPSLQPNFKQPSTHVANKKKPQRVQAGKLKIRDTSSRSSRDPEKQKRNSERKAQKWVWRRERRTREIRRDPGKCAAPHTRAKNFVYLDGPENAKEQGIKLHSRTSACRLVFALWSWGRHEKKSSSKKPLRWL